jgi:hypothetical protein
MLHEMNLRRNTFSTLGSSYARAIIRSRRARPNRSARCRESSTARRRRSRRSASTCSTTRSTGRMSSTMPTRWPVRTGAHLVWTARPWGDQGGRARGVVGRLQVSVADANQPSSTGATGDDPEARRWRAAARHPDDPGPGGASCGQAGAGADRRSGPRSHCRRATPTSGASPASPAGPAPCSRDRRKACLQSSRPSPSPTPSSKTENAHRAPPSRTPDPRRRIALVNNPG